MTTPIESFRNIAIIAHVDHGKTTLVDELLKQSGTFESHAAMQERAMDSNDLERERGITILSKCTSITWKDHHINIVDTPGHADFGGEVERVLKMVDSVLLLVDAYEGPMPQTKFVLTKSLALGLQPIVVINKIDRTDSRPDVVLDQIFDLFVDLDANDAQLDFPVVYTSAKYGFAFHEIEDYDPETVVRDLTPLFETILEQVRPPTGDPEAPLRMQVATLDYNDYVGRLAIGRIYDGVISKGMAVSVCRRDGSVTPGKILKLMGFEGLERVELQSARAGDIVMLAGLEGALPGETVCDPDHPVAMPLIDIDEPTVSMRFAVNNSPFAGRDGKYVTSRQIMARLNRELESNVSLRVEPTETPEAFKVCGRGELHISILIEQMRREGYEIGVGRPKVIIKEVDGETVEPIEDLLVECEETFSGTVIDKLNKRKGEMLEMGMSGRNTTRLRYRIPTRGLIGFRSEFLTDTRGTGVMYHNFADFGPYRGDIPGRKNGAMIVQETGETTGYALHNLQERGAMILGPGESVYAGQIVGLHSRDNDIVVNPCKKKHLTNIRAAGSDDSLRLTPPLDLSLEAALELINDDELVEVTPENIRIRKSELDHGERRRLERRKKSASA